MKKYLLFILILVSCYQIGFGQEKHIYLDTSYVTNKVSEGDWLIYQTDLKENLPNGYYKYYRAKENAKDSDLYLEVEGLVRDGKKESTFKYYSINRAGKKHTRALTMIINYYNGVLDGEFLLFSPEGYSVYRGFYQNGEKHGFFINYYHSTHITIYKRTRSNSFYN